MADERTTGALGGPARTAAATSDRAAAPARSARGGRGVVDDGSLVEEELLVEDVSIDGMCGVY